MKRIIPLVFLMTTTLIYATPEYNSTGSIHIPFAPDKGVNYIIMHTECAHWPGNNSWSHHTKGKIIQKNLPTQTSTATLQFTDQLPKVAPGIAGAPGERCWIRRVGVTVNGYEYCKLQQTYPFAGDYNGMTTQSYHFELKFLPALNNSFDVHLTGYNANNETIFSSKLTKGQGCDF